MCYTFFINKDEAKECATHPKLRKKVELDCFEYKSFISTYESHEFREEPKNSLLLRQFLKYPMIKNRAPSISREL